LRELGGTGLDLKGTAGLSLGEWTALNVAQALTFEDTVRVLAARGRFMQEACEERPGGMVSVIGLPVEKLAEICAATGAEIANLNSKEQTVLSGPKDAIAAASKLAGEAGAKKTVVLNVAGAYHSSLMSSAARKLEALLESVQFKSPTVPVIANVTGLPHGLPEPEEVKKALSSRTAQLAHGSPEEIKKTMVKQVTSSVRWLSSVEWFKNNGITEYIECGPGKVLSGLIKRIHSEASLSNVQDVASLKQAAEAVRNQK
jgi:[acyl-carrier-protein] S-malonyltransferase